MLLYVFIPWSAINLTDYYLVKHGDYDVASFFTPKGRYGGYLWRGLIAYLLAVAVQVPFIDQAFYTGPLVNATRRRRHLLGGRRRGGICLLPDRAAGPGTWCAGRCRPGATRPAAFDTPT